MDGCGVAGGERLVLLPVLLFRFLRDREVCGSGLQIFRVVVVHLLSVSEPGQEMKTAGIRLLARRDVLVKLFKQ